MSSKTVQVSLTPQLLRFVNELVSSGRYSTPSEVVQEGLNMLQAREHQVQEAYEAVKTLRDQLSIATAQMKSGKLSGAQKRSGRRPKGVRQDSGEIGHDLSEIAVPDDTQEMVRKLLKRKDKDEALAWLTSAPSGVHRGISEMDNRDSIAYVRHLYKLGVEN